VIGLRLSAVPAHRALTVITFLGDSSLPHRDPAVYWCIHKGLSGLGVLLLLKFHQRPAQVAYRQPSVLGRRGCNWTKPAVSTPSGHAQTNGAVRYLRGFWQTAARVLWIVILGLLIVLVALCGVYLGVHF
jgi:membrane-associated phospholipid phosphatase